MAGTPKDIAPLVAQLHDFIRTAENRASGRFPPMVKIQPDPPGRRKGPILEVYEECVSLLTPNERDELDRIIRMLSGAFG